MRFCFVSLPSVIHINSDRYEEKNNIQSFITTTDLKNIHKKYLKDAFIYEVKNGNVERKDNNGK